MAKGGEALKEVMGRGEEEELPLFQNGAFEVDGGEEKVREEKMLVDREFLDRYVPRGAIMRHTMRDLISKIRIVGGKDFACDEVRVEKVLFFLFFYGSISRGYSHVINMGTSLNWDSNHGSPQRRDLAPSVRTIPVGRGSLNFIFYYCCYYYYYFGF